MELNNKTENNKKASRQAPHFFGQTSSLIFSNAVPACISSTTTILIADILLRLHFQLIAGAAISIGYSFVSCFANAFKRGSGFSTLPPDCSSAVLTEE